MAKTAKKTNELSKSFSTDDILNMYKADYSVEMWQLNVRCLNELWGGGVNPGSMYSFWGEEGAGKSTLVFQIIQSLCRLGKRVCFLDVEKALNPMQQATFGLSDYVENGQLVLTAPNNYRDVELVLFNYVLENDFDAVVIDSETAIQVHHDEDKNVSVLDPRFMGLKARQSQAVMNKAKSLFYQHKIASFWIFQARQNIQVGGKPSWGAPETKSAGGRSSLHTPDIRTKVSVSGFVKDGDDVIGANIYITTEKNKFAPPNRVVKKKLIYGVGISKRIDAIDSAIEHGIITQTGSWYVLPTGEKYQGVKTLYDLPIEKIKEIDALLPR